MISFENVTKIFEKNRIVADISITFPESAVSAVVGLSGSGKTTLLRLISGELKPDYGKIVRKNNALCAYFDGKTSSFSGLKQNEIHTIWRLLYPKFDENKFRNLNENTNTNSDIFNLSLTAASNAEIMLFDEPLQQLDSEQKSEFLNLFKESAESGKTVVVAVSEIGDLENIADHVVVLNEGSIVLAAEVNEILATHRLFPGATTISPDYKVIGPVFNERLILTDENVGRKATLKEIVTGYIHGSSL